MKRIDRYQIIRLIGNGGMGEVYQAQDPNVDRLVAIKLLKESLNTDEFRNRFLGEARAAAKLEHPNVVKIFDAGRFRGRPFIAMECINGSSLAQVIARAEPLHLQRKLEILEELCAGLGWAHAAGIIHRDVKPGNVMLNDLGHVKIVDFGIAKSNTWDATSEQISMGTPCYMSPEQLRQQPVDHRTDMFSAAVVAYELLTYHKLFEGDAVQQVSRLLSGYIPPMGAFAPAIPVTLERHIRRALVLQPADRFKDMADLRRALASVREQIPQLVPGLTPGPKRSSETVPVEPFPFPEPVKAAPRTWLTGVAVGVTAVAALILGAWLLFTRPVSDIKPATVPREPGASPTYLPPVKQKPPSGLKASRGPNANNAGAKTAASGSATARMDSRDSDPVPSRVEQVVSSPNAEERAAAAAPAPPPAVSTPADPPESSSDNAPASFVSRKLSVDDESGIRSALKAYEAAYEKLSSVPVKKIWPTLTHDETTALDSKFLDAQSYRVEMSGTQIASINPTRAKVSCVLTERITLKHGDARILTSVATIILKKTDDGWFIDEISSRALKR